MNKKTLACLLSISFIFLTAGSAFAQPVVDTIDEQSTVVPAEAADLIAESDAAAAESGQSVDSIETSDGKKAVVDLTRDDILNLSYDDLINMPFEILMALADKLEISVEELLSLKMTVASKAGGTLREQPGILSVITGDDIRRSGARDLIDVLRLVPGFYFGLDVNGVTGVGLRGNWGHEGKILMLQDGQEMNDLTYYIYPYGNHFPIDQIKRIEIIRGPGSSLYGGAAELGVINIITKTGADLNGVNASFTVGRYQDMFGNIIDRYRHDEKIHPWDIGRATAAVSLGEKIKDIDIALHGSFGLAAHSDGELESWYFRDWDATTLDHPSVDYTEDQAAEMPSTNINLGVKWHDLGLRFIYDYCKTWGVDTWVYDNTYHHYFGEVRYDKSLLDGKLVISPKYNFKKMFSWGGVLDPGNIDYMRNTIGISFLADPLSWLNITGGIEDYYDRHKFMLQVTGYTDNAGEPIDNTFWNGLPVISFNNFSGYLQGLVRTKWGMNFTLGGRGEYHSQYGSAIAPRFGITQIIKDLHFKLLISKAFRSPTIGALVLPFDEATGDDPQLAPEETYVQELEAGYRINKNMFITANAFNIMMDKPICYFDLGDVWGYQNISTMTGSWGAEVEYTARYNKANMTLNYSFYSNLGYDELAMVLDDDTVGTFINVPGIKGPYLAAPQHKIGLNTSFNVWRDLWIAPSAVVYSTTYGYMDVTFDTTYDDPETPDENEFWVTGTQMIDSIGPTILMNLFVTYENMFTKGLNLSIGVYDIFGTKYPWIQAYNGFGIPIPGPSREFLLKLTYNIPIKR